MHSHPHMHTEGKLGRKGDHTHMVATRATATETATATSAMITK